MKNRNHLCRKALVTNLVGLVEAFYLVMVTLKYPEPKFCYIYREFYKGVPKVGYLQISGLDSSSNPFALYKSFIVWMFEVKTETIRFQPLIQDILVVLLFTSLFCKSL